MIKINLLARRSKPLVALWKDLSILSGTILILFITILFIKIKMDSKIKRLLIQQQNINKEIESSKVDIKKIEQLKKDKTALESKISIIASLREKQNWPVHILDELSSSTPDHIWLYSFINQEDTIKIEGITPSYNAVSDFMRKLDNSPYFTEIELLNIQQNIIRDKSFHKFKISFKIEFLLDDEQGKKDEVS